MKKTKRTTAPSMIRPTHSFTSREREAFIAWQKPDDTAPAGWVTGHEAGIIGIQVIREAGLRANDHIVTHASEVTEDRDQRLRQGKMISPLLLALQFAAGVVIDHNGETMGDATQDKIDEVLDAVEACWADPMAPESWPINTTPEGDSGIDVVKLLRHIRRVTKEVLAHRGEAPETLDERYRIMFNLGGRGAADHMLAVLRSTGALGKLRATKGTTHVVDREGYERLMRGLGRPYYCSDVHCVGEAKHYTWDEVSEFAEDGKVAVHVRRQERRDGKWVTAIAACGEPSRIDDLIAEGNAENGYVVVESEDAA